MARFARFADGVAAFLKDHCRHGEIDRALFAVAGPVQGDRCVLTNCSWVVDTREFSESFSVQARIINDFEAVAYSLPWLASADLAGIGGGRAELAAPMAVLGPGTGLGVACLVPGTGKRLVISSEGGHATLAGANDREDVIIKQLRNRFGHVSAERLLSGDGLENIHQAIVELDGIALEPRSAADITKRALDGDCRVARDALTTFCAFLGSKPHKPTSHRDAGQKLGALVLIVRRICRDFTLQLGNVGAATRAAPRAEGRLRAALSHSFP